jgi:hypothetical protein
MLKGCHFPAAPTSCSYPAENIDEKLVYPKKLERHFQDNRYIRSV